MYRIMKFIMKLTEIQTFLHICVKINKMTSVFHVPVLLLIMNFVITLLKWICRLWLRKNFCSYCKTPFWKRIQWYSTNPPRSFTQHPLLLHSFLQKIYKYVSYLWKVTNHVTACWVCYRHDIKQERFHIIVKSLVIKK